VGENVVAGDLVIRILFTGVDDVDDARFTDQPLDRDGVGG
jgi:hypothetical protein